MRPPLIECNDLIKIYPGAVEGLNVAALRGITLSINKGEFISIIGPSGSGKSTFIRLLGGLDKPSSGELFFEGNLLNTYTEKQLEKYRQNVGFLYQLPENNLLSNLTLIQNVILPMLIATKFRGQEKKRAHELLNKIGLLNKTYRKPHELSGGECQRASLAVALACDPVILLADEPTGELDAENSLKIIAYLKYLNQELGITIIVVTHDMRFAKGSDIIYILKDGKISNYVVNREKSKERVETISISPNGTIHLPKTVLENLLRVNGDNIEFKIIDGKIKLNTDKKGITK